MTNEVTVFVGSDQGVSQPETFRCCPLGVQFYSDKELPAYEVMEFKLQTPPEGELNFLASLECAGVVVHCQKNPGEKRYRVWLLFLDLPENVRSRLHCFGKNGGTLCPHCENY
ncbi:MAG: hypothetical protein U1E27_14470 [Kiritimatiellia bacterium]|nr:hypothetical protein [Kiritimatiellia bacterium]